MPPRTSAKLAGCAALALAGLAATAEAQDCAALAQQNLANLEIGGATLVAAGQFTPPGGNRFGARAYADLPAFCRVEAVARPAPGSAIGIEVWLPSDDWNGKLQGVGNGAWAGSISYSAMAGALAAGYVTASTDTGHRGGRPDFLREHADKVVDFAERAVHEMTVAAKALTAAYYGRTQARAYFVGCSTGGRQALTAAQRYPDDFDGIIAGAPAYYPSHIQGMQVWTAAVSNRSDAGKLEAAQFELVNSAAIAACDTLDGVADGVLENPRICPFDPGTLVCADRQSGSCLSEAQVETVREIYRGPQNRAGAEIYPGLARGSEAGWSTLSGDTPLALALETYEILVYNGADWDWRRFDAERDIATAVERLGPLMDANDPDLGEFVGNGGKLLLYHGWSDPGIPPEGTIRYYEAVQSTLGDALSNDSVRLFMVPGMGHCAGGTGTDRFDAVAALDNWLESGAAPASLPAAREAGGATIRTRPLCAFPSVAQYDGSGSTDEADNFTCR
jgi:feruloyl esterase